MSSFTDSAQKFFREAQRKGVVEVWVDARGDWARECLPKMFRLPCLRLDLNRPNGPMDGREDERGITETLSFNMLWRPVFIPWTVVIRMSEEPSDGRIWIATDVLLMAPAPGPGIVEAEHLNLSIKPVSVCGRDPGPVQPGPPMPRVDEARKLGAPIKPAGPPKLRIVRGDE